MQDKRILKTKKSLKEALIRLIDQKSFEKISVTEICDEANVSRISFYAHYKDKYDLAEAIFEGYIREAYHEYRMNQQKNTENDPIWDYSNLLESILNLYFSHQDFFRHTNATENPYLFSLFYSDMYGIVRGFIRHNKEFVPKYPPRQTAAFLCNGFWGMISESNNDNVPEAQARANILAMSKDILMSDLFTRA